VKPVSLCIPPRPGELCAPVRLELSGEHTSLELTSRHRITRVELDDVTGAVAVWVDITDPETSRPVHVRFSVLPAAADVPLRAVRLAELERAGEEIAVFGTYQGVVSDEN
jgi:hypothetical protein